jgi:hemerythrin
MAYFDWSAKLETGIPKIDEQHKKLVSMINELYEAMLKGQGKESMGIILNGLSEYTKYHFSTEEAAFKKYEYANAAPHTIMHQAFIAKVGEWIEKQKLGSLVVSVEVLEFLTTWIKNHIQKEDMQYIPTLTGKSI